MVLRTSTLADSGAETMVIFPQISVLDRRGVAIAQPDFSNPTELRVTVSTDRQSDAELDGQVSNKILKVLTRKAPAKSWARVYFRGEQWDLAAPAAVTPGTRFSKATAHVSFILRSRNEKTP